MLHGMIFAVMAYVLFTFTYSYGFEAGREHQVKIDCEARGLIFHNRICWAVPRETELRGTL